MQQWHLNGLHRGRVNNCTPASKISLHRSESPIYNMNKITISIKKIDVTRATIKSISHFPATHRLFSHAKKGTKGQNPVQKITNANWIIISKYWWQIGQSRWFHPTQCGCLRKRGVHMWHFVTCCIIQPSHTTPAYYVTSNLINRVGSRVQRGVFQHINQLLSRRSFN